MATGVPAQQTGVVQWKGSTKMIRALLSFALLLLIPAILVADEGDDTLLYYISKSDFIVSGTLESRAGVLVDRDGGWGTWMCNLRINEVLKGSVITSTVAVTIYALADKRPLYMNGDTSCILFLRGSGGGIRTWQNADPWFGVQPYNWLMANRIKDLVKQKAK